MANIVAISSFCQVTLTQEEYNKLPEDVKKELSTSKEMKKYSDYASWGKEIGVAVNETLKAVEESSIRISKTEIGQSAIFILKWKFLYKDFIQIIVGSILLIICIGLLIYIIRRRKSENSTDEEQLAYAVVASIVTFIASMITIFSWHKWKKKKTSTVSGFSERRTGILEVYNKAKADLEVLNKDIDDQIAANTSEMERISLENKELSALKSNNESTIKVFAKLFRWIPRTLFGLRTEEYLSK